MRPPQTESLGASPARAQQNLLSITPFFIVADLQASIAHYIERFGFALEFQGPPDDVYYAQLRRDGIAIMLKTIAPEVRPYPNHTRHEWARWDAYIYTVDPDSLFSRSSSTRRLVREGAVFHRRWPLGL